MSESAAQQRIDAIWRIEGPAIIAGLTRMLRDLSTAEDVAHDALIAALEEWPRSGIPVNPGAWLMTTAKRRAIDLFRRRKMLNLKHEEIAYSLDASSQPDLEASLDDDVGDDVLRLMFTACHPVLAPDARVALTLRLIGGLTTDEIARACLVTEPTIAQRIVRAKKTIAKAGVPFEVPRGADRIERLEAVLEVIYLVFNEGYTATAGGDWMRPSLCDEALRLGRVAAGLMPAESEVHGLVALMELQASRARARTSAAGDPIRLLEQDRARWDWLQIQRGLDALERARSKMVQRGRSVVNERARSTAPSLGPYAIQAELAACHARARQAADTDWTRIAHLYGELAQISPSPIVELNRAVAVAMADGPAAGLAIIDRVAAEPSLRAYHLLPSVRGDLLERLGRRDEAALEFARAASLTRNARERDLLIERARQARSTDHQ